MKQKQLVLLWNTRVVTQDGRSGRICGAVLAPRSIRISHLVIRHGLRSTDTILFGKATQTPDSILVLLPPVRENPTASLPRRGSIRFSVKNIVRCADASSLPLQGFLVDPNDHTTTSLLVGSIGDPKVIAIDRIDNLGSGSPSATGNQILDLPSYRSDEEAQKCAERVLQNSDPTGGTTYGSIRLEVHDGTAYMMGNVRLPVQREEAEQVVRRSPGVIHIQTDILTDREVEITIAEHAARVELTGSGTLFIKCFLGHVTLTGSLASQEQVHQATSLASATDGVLDVATDIAIVAPLAEQGRESEGQKDGEEATEKEQA